MTLGESGSIEWTVTSSPASSQRGSWSSREMSRFVHECVPLAEEEDTYGSFSLVCARLKCVRIRPFIGVCFLPVKHLEREKHRAHSTEGTAFPGQYVYVRMTGIYSSRRTGQTGAAAAAGPDRTEADGKTQIAQARCSDLARQSPRHGSRRAGRREGAKAALREETSGSIV